MAFNEKDYSIHMQLYVAVLNYVRVAFKKRDIFLLFMMASLCLI